MLIQLPRRPQQLLDERVRTAAAGAAAGAASEIETTRHLLEKGTISEAEFDAIKAKALAAH